MLVKYNQQIYPLLLRVTHGSQEWDNILKKYQRYTIPCNLLHSLEDLISYVGFNEMISFTVNLMVEELTVIEVTMTR